MSFDVIVIGGGIAGTALTYAPAKAGAAVLLLERGRIAAQASGATMGMALWISLHTDDDLALAVQGIRRLAALSAELEADLSYRLLPALVLAPDEPSLTKLQHHSERLRRIGLPARIVDCTETAALEPLLEPGRYVGALYAEQGHLDPVALTHAYAQSAQRLGADVREYVAVHGFTVERGQVVAVKTRREVFSATHVVLAAGAWTRSLAAQAGFDLPLYHIHGQAVSTASLPLTLSCMLMVARPDGHSALERRVAAALGQSSDWDRWHDDDTGVQDMSMVQLPDGRVLLGQVSRASPSHGMSLCPAAITQIADAAAQLVPALANAPIERSWIAPVPFAPNQQAMLGLIPGSQNLFICAGFKSILTTAPIACQTLARQIVGEDR